MGTLLTRLRGAGFGRGAPLRGAVAQQAQDTVPASRQLPPQEPGAAVPRIRQQPFLKIAYVANVPNSSVIHLSRSPMTPSRNQSMNHRARIERPGTTMPQPDQHKGP
ncbi:hypothetical protein GCM10010493_67290 [Streptomyces lavendulae subsp. grasserius]